MQAEHKIGVIYTHARKIGTVRYYIILLAQIQESCMTRDISPYLIFNIVFLQLVKQPNWLPDPITPAAGMELEKLSFLGPFFALSVFAEDSVCNFFIISENECHSTLTVY